MTQNRPRVGLLQNSDVPVIDAYLREYPIPYSITMEIVTNNSNQKLFLPDISFFEDKYILGVFIRPQNAGGTRYSKNGRLLITNDELANAFLTITQSGSIVCEDLPLESFVQDPFNGGGGKYSQLIIDRGFSTSNSYVRFSNSAPANNRAVELNWVWVYRNPYCVM